MKWIIIGGSITSSAKSPHATTYRALVNALAERGHHVLFLERSDHPTNVRGDIPATRLGRVEFYDSFDTLQERFRADIRGAGCVMVDSDVRECDTIGKWVCATLSGLAVFYDLEGGASRQTVLDGFDIVLSAGFGDDNSAGRLPPCVDLSVYFPETETFRWDLGHIAGGARTCPADARELLIGTANRWRNGRFVCAAGGLDVEGWPPNIARTGPIAPAFRRQFFNSQHFTLNAPHVDGRGRAIPDAHLFEAAACATPVVSRYWQGLEQLFDPGKEIFIVETPDDVERVLRDTPPRTRAEVGWNARMRVLRQHTALHRADTLEALVRTARARPYRLAI